MIQKLFWWISCFCLSCGAGIVLLLALTWGIFQVWTPSIVADANESPPAQLTQHLSTNDALSFTKVPQKIIIPRLELALPVKTAEIAFNTWEVSPTTASFGQYTTLPGEVGNTVVFAHARAGLFGELPQLESGDTVHLFTESDWFTYRVTSVEIVAPEKTDVLFSSGGRELTLFTCIGPGDSHRFVVKAELVGQV